MRTYCVKCRKDSENINPTIVRTKNNRSVIQSKGLLSNLGIKTPSSKIPLLNILF